MVPKSPVAIANFSCSPPDLNSLKLHPHCYKRPQILFHRPQWFTKPMNINQQIPSTNIVTYRPSTRQRLGKHIPAKAYAPNNRTSIVTQWISKQAFSTIQRLFFLCGPCREVIKGQRMSFEWEPCGGGVEYLHRESASRRRRRKGSLKTGTVKYGREIQGTRTRETLRWRGPAAYTKDRPVLSSERAPHTKRP
jgi:hypothetical protein